jgi:hypothetical protein
MNERIREILTQCQQESIDGPEYPHWTDFEKFAELIVRECLSVSEDVANADGGNGPWFDGYICGVEEVTRRVKQHFGVEE